MMKFVLFVVAIFVFRIGNTQEKLPAEYRDEVGHFIDCIKKKDIAALSGLISFPLIRSYPIPSIKDSSELRLRFAEVFDDSLVAMITSSDIDNDWSEVGWRGIMLANGALWLDTDGKLLRVNYQSAVEASREKELIEKDRNAVHPSLREFEYPDVVLETAKFRIRIDGMPDGTYRYASWGINKQMSEEPDLILKRGVVNFLGSGGNHEYVFVSGDFKYICSINILGTDETPPADLVVLKKGKRILYQDATIVRP